MANEEATIEWVSEAGDKYRLVSRLFDTGEIQFDLHTDGKLGGSLERKFICSNTSKEAARRIAHRLLDLIDERAYEER